MTVKFMLIDIYNIINSWMRQELRKTRIFKINKSIKFLILNNSQACLRSLKLLKMLLLRLKLLKMKVNLIRYNSNKKYYVN